VAVPKADKPCDICGCTKADPCPGGCDLAYPGLCNKCLQMSSSMVKLLLQRLSHKASLVVLFQQPFGDTAALGAWALRKIQFGFAAGMPPRSVSRAIKALRQATLVEEAAR
jgi:hypothetical protein